jgi:hypothetical protein
LQPLNGLLQIIGKKGSLVQSISSTEELSSTLRCFGVGKVGLDGALSVSNLLEDLACLLKLDCSVDVVWGPFEQACF